MCGCGCAGVDVCAGVWVCLHMCSAWVDSNHTYNYTIIIYSSNYLLFSPSLYLPSSHHLLISCLLQLKCLHPFAFGDSALDHSKMDLSVSSKRWRLTALNLLRVLHAFPSHTHMHWVRYVVTCHRHVIIPILLEGGALQQIHLMVAIGSSSHSHTPPNTLISRALDSLLPHL